MTRSEYPLARAAEYPLARRTVIKGIGAGMAAAGLTGALRAQAATMDGSEAGGIWSSEYWTKKADIPLWMYRKRIGAPKPGEPARPVVFFVHGSSITSRVFDLSVPEKGEYSVMNEFARYGFDCWTMDHEKLRQVRPHVGQCRYRQRRPGSEGRGRDHHPRDRPEEVSLHRRILGRAARRRLCHGCAGAGGPPGVRRLHLQG
jgi:hypothetical protein